MEDISATDYEYLISRCHQVPRYGIAAADADIYRDLLTCYHACNDAKQGSEKQALLEQEYISALRGVSINVGKAISTAQVKFKRELGADAIHLFDDLKIKLSRPTLETLSNVIKLAQTIMAEHDIYAV